LHQILLQTEQQASETQRTVKEAFGDIAIVRTETYGRFMRFKNGWDVSRWSTF
jgi:hypothetical protein